MIKTETIGMLNVARNNPVLKSDKDLVNNSFLVQNGVTYLIDNVLTGDDAYRDGVVIPAGEFLNGYDVAAWDGMHLIVDEKHIAYAESKSYADLVAGTTKLKVNEDGQLKVDDAVASGVYFVVEEKTSLTGKAVKVRIVVA